MPQKNAVIFVDFENIYEALAHYGADPLEIDFFPVVFDRLRALYQFNPIKCNIYFNFNKFSHRLRNELQRLGLTLCPSMNKGKNSGDLLLVIDAMKTLYENPAIDVFVIISSDHDMSSILTEIRCKGRLTCLMTEKRVMNQTLIDEADIHEFIEDIFGLRPEMLIDPRERALLAKTGRENITLEAMAQAKQVAVMLYNSIMWKTCEEKNDPLTFDGYLARLSKGVRRDIEALRKDFEIAVCLGYVKIYRDEQKKCLCFKKGEKYAEIMADKHGGRKEGHE